MSAQGGRFPIPDTTGFQLPGFPMTPRLHGQTVDGSFKATGKTVVITGGSQVCLGY